MIKNLLKLSLFLLGPITFAQSGVISGKVVDQNDQFSLPGATLRIENTNKYTVSDQNGNYQFLNLPTGIYSVSIDYLGYETSTQEIEVKDNQTAVIDFSLSSGLNELSEVVVIGDYLKGQAKALNQQKNSGNITNIISSDQVGRFPDANVGDALKRVPGITMQNDQGEARNIIIRGLSPELNSVMLNGDRIPSAEGDNRNVQMDLIPSDMISTIEVNKTLTPDMDADAIGGEMPARYFEKLIKIDSENYVQLLVIDTNPFVSKYKDNPEKYLGINAQNTQDQIKWLEDKLSDKNPKIKWRLVVGHHPLYSGGKRIHEKETLEIKTIFEPIFKKYNVDAYFTGHEHDLQIIKTPGHSFTQFLSGAGSELRPTGETKGTMFAASVPGFMAFSLNRNSLNTYVIQAESNGYKIIYQTTIKK